MKLPTLAELEVPAGSGLRMRVAEHELRRTRHGARPPRLVSPATSTDRWALEPPVQPFEEGWFMTYLDVMTLLLVAMIVMLAFSGAARDRPGVLDAARAAAMRVQVAIMTPKPAAAATTEAPRAQTPESDRAAPALAWVIPLPDEPPPYPAAPESDFGLATSRALAPGSDPAQTSPQDAEAAANTAVAPVADKQPHPSATTAFADALADEGKALAAALPLGELGKDVEVVIKRRSVSFRINSAILFDTGQETLSGGGSSVLRQAAHLLADASYDVTVEGHTDSVPVRSSARYPSNWELSSARAGSVVRYLQANGVAKSHLRAVGFADTRPIADNHSAQGRARNRRVELVVSRHRDPTPGE